MKLEQLKEARKSLNINQVDIFIKAMIDQKILVLRDFIPDEGNIIGWEDFSINDSFVIILNNSSTYVDGFVKVSNIVRIVRTNEWVAHDVDENGYPIKSIKDLKVYKLTPYNVLQS